MAPLLETAVRGAIIGFVIMMPVGPMATLCIMRTLGTGRTAGIATGAGVAFADLIYSTIAALGVPHVERIVALRMPVAVAGGLLLVAVGVAGLRARPGEPGTPFEHARSPARAFGSAFVLTLGVPASVFVYAAVFATFGHLRTPPDLGEALVLTSATFAGSVAWFSVLCTLLSAGRGRFPLAALARLERGMAAVLVCCGLGSALYAVLHP